MTTEKLTFLEVLRKYILYSEAYSQYNQLEEDDKQIVKPYIDRLRQRWQEDLKEVRISFNAR